MKISRFLEHSVTNEQSALRYQISIAKSIAEITPYIEKNAVILQKWYLALTYQEKKDVSYFIFGMATAHNTRNITSFIDACDNFYEYLTDKNNVEQSALINIILIYQALREEFHTSISPSSFLVFLHNPLFT